MTINKKIILNWLYYMIKPFTNSNLFSWPCLSERQTLEHINWENLQDQILGKFNGVSASPLPLKKIIDDSYEPGTFKIGERGEETEYLYSDERISFREWVYRVVSSDFNKILQCIGEAELNLCEIRRLEKKIQKEIYNILTYTPPYNPSKIEPLSKIVWNQEYSDVIRRIEMFLLKGYVDCEINLYKEINEYGESIAFKLIDKFDSNQNFSLEMWCKLSIAAGLIGLHKKTTLDATSRINQKSFIAWDEKQSIEYNVENIYADLLNIINRNHRVDYVKTFLTEIFSLNRTGFSIAVFPDDFIETIFLLKFYEKLLLSNPCLKVYLIPKSRRCGNDATDKDVLDFLERNSFSCLNRLLQEHRFIICNKGPKVGGLNFKRLSREVLKIIKESDILDIRGARAYEMAQGIKKEAYYGFMVCREISESVTGLDGESSHMVFLHQNPGDRSFNGFKERHLRKKKSPSGQEYMVSSFSTTDYVVNRLKIQKAG